MSTHSWWFCTASSMAEWPSLRLAFVLALTVPHEKLQRLPMSVVSAREDGRRPAFGFDVDVASGSLQQRSDNLRAALLTRGNRAEKPPLS